LRTLPSRLCTSQCIQMSRSRRAHQTDY
jgi:hypothetical protein